MSASDPTRGAIARNHVRITGEGPGTLVFGHGLGGDGRSWRHVLPAFEPRWRTVVYDHVGSGGSQVGAYDAARHATLDGFAQDLVEVLDEIGGPPVIHVGHSVGGMIGLLASLQRPDRFAGLVLLASSPRFLDDPPRYRGGFTPAELDQLFELLQRNHLGWADALAPLAMGEEAGPALTGELREGLGALNPLVAQRFGRLAFLSDLRDRLGEVSVPTLLVHCERDAAVPREVGDFLHARIPGSRRVELPVAGHCPHLSHPDRTVAVLREFLEELHAG